jgi:hypothetical protein
MVMLIAPDSTASLSLTATITVSLAFPEQEFISMVHTSSTIRPLFM